ncbi:hypothetical protein H696_02760 [Fonticula alba]|uniref:Sorting nexin/Vps5-like C-terminal domain-containing protein n=1 Tax=Fonticula alba TaxID=691883 RepID=A0A058Z8H9_FONAL|nr:hypothetical protein H696_02760 [Fonticula alba]KCV70416.1 hypothetical protein H696_02760 [Fonticula alba]|eukprot:XP_009494932.1 hypothetical protein H696_02760 [Fonticula alba]
MSAPPPLPPPGAPSFTQPLTPSSLADSEYLLKKSRQFQRFFERLGSKTDIASSPDMMEFMSFVEGGAPAAHLSDVFNNPELAANKAGSLSAKSLLDSAATLARVGGNTNNSTIRVHKLTYPIDEVDQPLFDTRRTFISNFERDHIAMIDKLAEQIRSNRAYFTSLKDLTAQMSTMSTELNDEASPGATIMDKHFATLSQSIDRSAERLEGIATRQITDEVSKLGETILDQRQLIHAVRALMNRRTAAIEKFDDRRKEADRLASNHAKLLRKHQTDSHPEVVRASQEIEAINEEKLKLLEDIATFEKCMTAEFQVLDAERASDYLASVAHFARTQLSYAEEIHSALAESLNDLRCAPPRVSANKSVFEMDHSGQFLQYF